ncbi:hypothetical protein JOL79_22930 [Microbispora sp. RL4-1S]|uniref:Uncharacterized protein n=1 Tax=Microbispora oryzae TaxID=2806554 RepID=A0A940WP52_9ACTN|nr:DUF6203 family protein [Microbispora oryzae]MBP2706668.1 hypothetical protein [Microbispora oryzae]
MKRILQLFATRWLSRTPLGLVVLGIGWLIIRKRRGRRPERSQDLRVPGRRSDNPYVWKGPSPHGRP